MDATPAKSEMRGRTKTDKMWNICESPIVVRMARDLIVTRALCRGKRICSPPQTDRDPSTPVTLHQDKPEPIGKEFVLMKICESSHPFPNSSTSSKIRRPNDPPCQVSLFHTKIVYTISV